MKGGNMLRLVLVAIAASFAEFNPLPYLQAGQFHPNQETGESFGDQLKGAAEREEIEARTQAIRAKIGQTDPGEHLSTNSGRFVFGQIGGYRRDQYMLDTHTGRLWLITADSTGAESLAEVQYYKYEVKRDTVIKVSSAAPFAPDTSLRYWTPKPIEAKPQAQPESTVSPIEPHNGSAAVALGILGGLAFLGVAVGLIASQ
jgi:hypothetical protein